MKGLLVGFRKIRGRVIPIYKKHETAANAGLAVGTLIGTQKVAETVRHEMANKFFGKKRRGFGTPLANFTFDISASTALAYLAAKKFPKVQSGFSTISKFVKRSF